MIHRRNIGLALLMVWAGLSTACYDEPDTVLHEPGEYKGQSDPLLNRITPSHQDMLEQRFNQVQTDR